MVLGQMRDQVCNPCGARLTEKGYASFPCPSCGLVVGRCAQCRDQSVKYHCNDCGFEGP